MSDEHSKFQKASEVRKRKEKGKGRGMS